MQLEIGVSTPEVLRGAVRSTPEFDVMLEIPTAELAAHRKRLQKEIERLEQVIANSRKQLSNQQFLARAPKHVIETMRVKLKDYEQQLERNKEALMALPDN